MESTGHASDSTDVLWRFWGSLAALSKAWRVGGTAGNKRQEVGRQAVQGLR